MEGATARQEADVRFAAVLTRVAGLAALAGMAAVAAQADEAAPVVETARLGKSQVTVTEYPFLTPDELTTLKLVMTNRQALAIFVPGKADKFSAMAVSPDEGFIREGKPVASAIAVADLPDAEAARQNAVESCDKARGKKSAACVVVLEVGPVPKK